MNFFAAEMAALGAKLLWTGHQKDDIVETLLMRLARGSGAAGLAAPRPVQTRADGRVFLRPLLTVSKVEIVAALRDATIAWREDASNVHGDFFRNRIRNDVVPAWRVAAENDALEGAALTRELLEEDDAALEAWLAELMRSDAYGANTLDVRNLIGRPRAIWRRALRRWRPLADVGRSGFAEVLKVCERGSGRTSVGEGLVEMREGVLQFQSVERDRDISSWGLVGLLPGMTIFLPDGGQIAADAVVFTSALRERIYAGKVDASREAYVVVEPGEKLAVRVGKEGDRYRPLGAPGSAKLQDLFVNRKIPVALRGVVPLVCGERGNIMWIPGFSPAEDSKLTDANVTGVHLTYESGTYTVRP
jgi:tRNA(Ile)-lysidine synthase